MSINCAILGILSYKPMTGYDIKKIIQDSSFMHWSGNNNQIYKALIELLDKGLVTNEVKHQESSPTKKIYTITVEGLAALKEWVLSPAEPGEIKKPFLVQLAWSKQLNTSELNALLDGYENQVRIQLLMEQNNKKGTNFLPGRTAMEIAIWSFINDNIRRAYENELVWIQDLRSAIAGIPNENDENDVAESVNMKVKYTILGKNHSIVYIESEDILIADPQSALDLVATVHYETDCSRIILDKEAINEEFFRLSSGIAGEVLQKFINYHTKLAIIGDFSKYKSKPLHDFIYESNNGKDIFFADNLDQAVEKLDSAK